MQVAKIYDYDGVVLYAYYQDNSEFNHRAVYKTKLGKYITFENQHLFSDDVIYGEVSKKSTNKTVISGRAVWLSPDQIRELEKEIASNLVTKPRHKKIFDEIKCDGC